MNNLDCPCCGFRQTSYCVDSCQQCHFPMRAYNSAKNDEQQRRVIEGFLAEHPEHGDRLKAYLQQRAERETVESATKAAHESSKDCGDERKNSSTPAVVQAQSAETLLQIKKYLGWILVFIIILTVMKGCDNTSSLLKSIDNKSSLLKSIDKGVWAPREYRGTIKSY